MSRSGHDKAYVAVQWSCLAVGLLWPLVFRRPDLYLFTLGTVLALGLAMLVPQSFWDRKMTWAAPRRNLILAMVAVWLTGSCLFGVVAAMVDMHEVH